MNRLSLLTLGALAMLVALTAPTQAAPPKVVVTKVSSRLESEQMVPDNGAIKNEPGTPTYVTWTFHLFITAAIGPTTGTTPGEFCTATASDKGLKVRILTAAHCFLLPGLATAKQVIAIHDDANRSEDVFDLNMVHLIVSDTFKRSIQRFQLRPNAHDTNRPLKEVQDEIAYPASSAAADWPDDWAYFDIEKTMWRWQTFPMVAQTRPLKVDDTVLLTGGGCDLPDPADCYTKAASYPTYSRVFRVDRIINDRRAYVVEDGDARVSFGDSGGSAVLVAPSGNQLFGVISGFQLHHPLVLVQRADL